MKAHLTHYYMSAKIVSVKEKHIFKSMQYFNLFIRYVKMPNSRKLI